jgi:hypothetical protein
MGHAIAHGLGHLLARSNRHSAGIMPASWAARMRHGNLYIAVEDVTALRKNLKASNLPVRLASAFQPEL